MYISEGHHNTMNETFDYYNGTFEPSLLRRIFIKIFFVIAYYVLYSIYLILYGVEDAADHALRSIFKCTKPFHQYNISSIRQPYLSIIQPPSNQIDIKNIPHKHSFSALVNLNKFSNTDTCIFYIHGGGYISGDIAGYLGMAEKVSLLCKCPVFLPQYRLAPEVSIETSVDDLYEAFHSIGTNFKNVIIMGESAGGGLAVLLMKLLIHNNDNIRIKCLILFSPMLNLECNSNSHIHFNDPMLKIDMLKYCTKLALQGNILSESNNPIMGTFSIFPPTFISVADDELLYDDAVQLKQILWKENIYCELSIRKKTCHAFPILWKYSTTASYEFQRMLEFIRKSKSM